MASTSLDGLNILSTPVWVVSPQGQEILFANAAARDLSGALQLAQLRHGPFSVHAQRDIEAYLPALVANDHVVEIWTVYKDGTAIPLSCRLTLAKAGTADCAIVVEGLCASQTSLPGAEPAVNVACTRQPCHYERGFYERLFRMNTAPMLLIDPALDGRIVDANLAALRFYGYSRDEMSRKHTWEINILGRDVLPVMHEVAKLPGGHKPLNFEHRLADGSTRFVQTYAGPVELEGRRLMLAIIHDITEQKRLEQALEQAALRDPLTGLGNRRHFLMLLEQVHNQSRRYGQDYSMMLVDADHFKAINDQYGHHAGDELLILLAKSLEDRVRESDAVCRWGGEEFVVLLPQTALDGALQLAEAIRESVAALRLPALPGFTVSIGVAQRQADEDTAQLFRRVDSALYRAKAAGRNAVLAA